MTILAIAGHRLPVCQFCGRPISCVAGMFWEDDRGEIYCQASIGPHVPAKPGPDENRIPA